MKHSLAICALGICMGFSVKADQGGVTKIDIPMVVNAKTAAYYVNVDVAGVSRENFLVDTGSSYTVINEASLTLLKNSGKASYVKDLSGHMADNSRKLVSVYRIEYLDIGGKCTLRNVEAAIFPGNVRQILGLNALGKAAPFLFSTTPPSLALQKCDNSQVVANNH